MMAGCAGEPRWNAAGVINSSREIQSWGAWRGWDSQTTPQALASGRIARLNPSIDDATP